MARSMNRPLDSEHHARQIDSVSQPMENFLLLAGQWSPVLAGYIVGATPFGFLAGKMRGIDIREHGSGNIGATNVFRTLGKPTGIAVFILDVLKGLVPVLIARLVTDDILVAILTAVATILGHNYTFWLGFKGGKGIATPAGAMLPVLLVPLIVAVSAWGIVFRLSRYVSLASLAAALVIPLTVVVESLVRKDWQLPLIVFALLICFSAFWKHRSNIARLKRGEEHKFERKKAPSS